MTAAGVDSGVRCYSLRRANPFRGVAAVVKTTTGRAISIDGSAWQIQVMAQAPKGIWSGEGHEATLKYFRFGNWSCETGIKRVPLNPILNVGWMLGQTAALVCALERHADTLPFPMLPELEHWLLDREGIPLALLGTAVDESELNEMGGCEWSAGGRGEQPFIASSSGTEHTEPGTGAPHRDAVRLERQVRNAAGRRLNSQWFRREAGRAEGLEHQAGAGLEGRHLPEAAFPPLSLREDWSGSEEQALVSDYIAWLAPYLLTLPWLDETVRRRLEGQATRRALLVDAIWRLYPRILDQDLLNRARVEARLRRASD